MKKGLLLSKQAFRGSEPGRTYISISIEKSNCYFKCLRVLRCRLCDFVCWTTAYFCYVSRHCYQYLAITLYFLP